MSYLLLIVEPTGQRAERGLDAGRDACEQMGRFGADLQAKGLLVGANSLATSGVRLQMREGRRVLTDGPFAEAKELVGGYFLLNCQSREEALAIAAECPAAQWASVEVRRIAPCYED
ncbi:MULTISPECIES: YciI family protein [unclassified Roseateles]|uniref:YciI family protein n=1 Tax=unclassified Roseateles TaxID=2626991 RepID=UPI0022B86A10|nr:MULTISPECIES: YciI family protein [unclassified Roseateles]MCZ7882002.1 YciI family protein [Paucibacter sp. M5-1]MDC6171128.1 YciI family protein [Paucibacter sp. XJ19-41]